MSRDAETNPTGKRSPEERDVSETETELEDKVEDAPQKLLLAGLDLGSSDEREAFLDDVGYGDSVREVMDDFNESAAPTPLAQSTLD